MVLVFKAVYGGSCIALLTP
ncbi:hypothetical protein CGJ05_22385 [Vibrio parahaemolyticus]|nr:hypothetical protein CGJ05_22385 [Vibrio parahaemolyticus]